MFNTSAPELVKLRAVAKMFCISFFFSSFFEGGGEGVAMDVESVCEARYFKHFAHVNDVFRSVEFQY